MKRRDAPRPGMALALVLLTAAIIVMFSSTMVVVWAVHNRLTLRSVNIVLAQQACQAGLSQAIYELNANPAWAPAAAPYTQSLTSASSTFSLTFDPASTAIPYSTNNAAGAAAVTGYGGRTVPPGYVHLVALGDFRGTTVAEEAVLRERPSVTFANAIWTDYVEGSSNSIVMGQASVGVTVDSFDSSQGVYPAGQANSGANLYTNAIASGRVQLKSTTRVWGNVTLGPGGSASTINAGTQGTNYTSWTAAGATTTAPTIVTPATSTTDISNVTTTLAPGAYRNLAMNANVVTLVAGVYRFNNLTDTNTPYSTLRFDTTNGPVAVYIVGGTVTLDYTHLEQVNSVKSIVPADAQILRPNASAGTLTLLGGPLAYLTISAPGCLVDFRGDLYGAIMADRVNFATSGSAASLHYDRALATRHYHCLLRQLVPWK